MDISAAMAEYHNLTAAHSDYLDSFLLASILLIVPATMAVCFLLAHLKGYYMTFWPGLGSVFLGAALGFIIGVLGGFATVPSSTNEIYNQSMEKITVQVNDAYGTNIPASTIIEAKRAKDHQVTLVSAEHDGKDKSLGVNFNEDKKTVTVYQGNVALTPSK